MLEHLNENLNSDWQRLCVVSIDEMKVKRAFQYLKDWQRVVMHSDYCQVVMVRGLGKKWEQVVYYDFGTKSSKELMVYIIQKLEDCKLIPVAVVSDFGPDNQEMWRDLNVTNEQLFMISQSNKKVFVFADFPQMLKLCRNHFLDHGFKVKDKLVIKKPIKRLIDSKSSGLNIAHKLTMEHVCVEKTRRMNVRLAVQLLSRSTGATLLSMRDILKNHKNGERNARDRERDRRDR